MLYPYGWFHLPPDGSIVPLGTAYMYKIGALPNQRKKTKPQPPERKRKKKKRKRNKKGKGKERKKENERMNTVLSFYGVIGSSCKSLNIHQRTGHTQKGWRKVTILARMRSPFSSFHIAV